MRFFCFNDFKMRHLKKQIVGKMSRFISVQKSWNFFILNREILTELIWDFSIPVFLKQFFIPRFWDSRSPTFSISPIPGRHHFTYCQPQFIRFLKLLSTQNKLTLMVQTYVSTLIKRNSLIRATDNCQKFSQLKSRGGNSFNVWILRKIVRKSV